MKNKGTILLIEDEVSFRKIYKAVIENDGYEVLEAADGELGWSMVQEKKPDRVLLDLVLPKLHGLEVLKKIRSNKATQDIPVLIFSVMGEQEDIKKGLAAGANDYTVKGFYSPNEILSKIHALLTKSDIEKNIHSYRLEVKDGRGDAAKLQQDIGLTKLFQCPDCDSEMVLELTPDYTRTDGHWFSAHFICPKCDREF